MGAAAIAQILIAVLPFVTTGVQDLIKTIEANRSDAQGAGEWTPEQETNFRATVFAKTQDPAYAPDSPPATGG